MLALAVLLLSASVAFAQDPSIRIVHGSNSIALTAADFRNMPQHTIAATDHGTKATFKGVLLRDALTKAGVPAGDSLKGPLLAQYVLVDARDNYRVIFAIAELDTAFTDKKVYLVSERDGKPLSEHEGPFRIVVPDEKKSGRWVRQVRSITVSQPN